MNAQTIDPRDVRTSPIAGSWYPGSPRELAEMVDELLARAQPPAEPALTPNVVRGKGSELAGGLELLALISPHAGYPYSGQTAAYSYRQLCDKKFDIVVLMGPSHYEDFGPFAVSAKKYYATPLGAVELDQEFISALARQISLTRVERDREHSLEIQLPFLQRVLGDFKLVPIMMSRPFYIVGAAAREYSNQLASALAALAPPKRILFVASSDLSHLDDYQAVKKFDARFAKLAEQFDVDALADYMAASGECRACGDAPIIAALSTAKKLGADRVRVLHLTNSSDVTGNRAPGQYTVGYMAAAAYKSEKAKAAA